MRVGVNSGRMICHNSAFDVLPTCRIVAIEIGASTIASPRLIPCGYRKLHPAGDESRIGESCHHPAASARIGGDTGPSGVGSRGPEVASRQSPRRSASSFVITDPRSHRAWFRPRGSSERVSKATGPPPHPPTKRRRIESDNRQHRGCDGVPARRDQCRQLALMRRMGWARSGPLSR